MEVMSEVSWRLNEHVMFSDIESSLSKYFSNEWNVSSASVSTCYDNVDGALWRADFLLFSNDDENLRLTRKGKLVAQATPSRALKFWWDLPKGAMQDTLRTLIGVRALLPVVTHEVSKHELVLYNEAQKIVVRACLIRSIVDGQCLQYLTLKPLRGYDVEFSNARRCIKRLVHSEANVSAHALLMHHGVGALAPRSSAPMPITETMPAEQAVRTMTHLMFGQTQKHVMGVVEDIDTEFLHSFRVGLRKTRSLISLMKKALPEALIDKVKPRLSGMAARTNQLRDLDVYLLTQDEYIAMLPTDFVPGMAELTETVHARRLEEHKRVSAYFSSATYQNDVDACLAGLSLQPSFVTPTSTKPVLHLVKRQVLRRYAALEAMSRQIRHDSEDADIHALRIEFKKLRYLIEFFLDLLPKRRSMKLLGDLKKIQGILGSFNDLSVQIDFLNDFQDQRRIEMTKALNGLTAILHLKKVGVRDRIFRALDGYFTENRAIEFGLIFGVNKQREMV